MKSWRQFVSESNATTAMPLAIACLSCGQSAAGSLPAITIALAPVWIAVWIGGQLRGRGVLRAGLDDLLVADLRERELAAAVGDDLVRVERVLRDEEHRLTAS